MLSLLHAMNPASYIVLPLVLQGGATFYFLFLYAVFVKYFVPLLLDYLFLGVYIILFAFLAVFSTPAAIGSFQSSTAASPRSL